MKIHVLELFEENSLWKLRDCAAATLCDNLKRHGFAIITIPVQHSRILQEAYEVGWCFFRRVPVQIKQQCKLLFNEFCNNKGLAGFNQPNPAKEVFRIRRGDAQPWPSSPEQFRVVMTRALELLESVAICCEDVLLQSVHLDSEKIFESILDYYKNKITFNILSSSPFDLFYYYNSENVADIVNCHEHVDPGLLTVVPCSPVAGLEIRDHKTGQWIAVENELNLTPLTNLIIFSGHTLQILTNDYYIGSVHRVTKNTRPRLSLVYEQRIKSDLNLDTFLGDLYYEYTENSNVANNESNNNNNNSEYVRICNGR